MARKPLNVEDPSLLGTVKERRQKLLKVNLQQYSDWHFANRVRAWLKAQQGYQLSDLRDLKTFKGVKTCDFHFEEGDRDYLIECKRINVDSKQQFDRFIDRLHRTALTAKRQVASAADALEINDHVGCLVMDISKYGMSREYAPAGLEGGQAVGWKPDSINKILQEIQSWEVGLERVIVTYDNVCFMDGKPVAIAHKVSCLADKERDVQQIYGGWTLTDVIFDEAKKVPQTHNSHEITLHSVTRPFAWIAYEYRMASDNESFWGEWKWESGAA